MGKLTHRYTDLADALASTLDPAVRRAMRSVSSRKARAALQRSVQPPLASAMQQDPALALPSCSVVQVESTADGAPATIPRGTVLTTKAQPACRFRTVYDLTLAPLAIASARFTPHVPPVLGVPDESACAIAITIESTDPAIALERTVAGPVRLFIDADPATRAALHDALFMRSLCTCVNAGREWFQLAALPFMPVGCLAGEALLPGPAGAPLPGDQQALRLLADYFAFPEKFDFIDIDLASALARSPAGTRRLTLHVTLPALPGAGAGALRSLAPSMLRLGCTPVINLFSRAAEPLPIAAECNTYPLRAFPLAEAEAMLHSVDAVTLLQAVTGGSMAVELPRFEVLRRVQADCYWLLRHAGTAGGATHTISFVDREQRPLALRGGTVAVQLTCTNGDAPASLPIGLPDGDLAGDGAFRRYPVRFLRRPSMPRPAADLDGLPPFSTEHGLPVLLDLLRRHAPADSPAVQRQLAGIVGLNQRAVEDWICFSQGSAWMRGTEVRLTINEAAFDRCSVFVFAQVIAELFASHAQEGSFARLVVLTLDGEERVRYCVRTASALPF